MKSWISIHRIWLLIVMIALTGVTIIYFGDFRLGAIVLAGASGALVLFRGLGARDKLLGIRTKNFDLSIYLFIALALGILAVVVPTI